MNHIYAFIHETEFTDLPHEVRNMVPVCVLDLVGALIGGRQTRLSELIHDHASWVFGGDQATLLLDGRRCSAPGAALANGMTIDSMDIHDGFRESLGHAGVHIFPAVLSVSEQLQASGDRVISGEQFLTSMVVGYDIACRAALALHATACDYHTSGAWGAVSSAALYSRLHELSPEQTRHALGIAEYHGPRSQMMRCIDHPTMLKDGSGWGAMAGVSAGMLAAQGFTGAPAITVEADDVAHYWHDLGSRWMIMEQGFKPHAVCWWAQPAIEATLNIVRQHQLRPEDISRIEVHTFEKATRLAHPRPATTEAAQYSLPYPVAAAVWVGGDGNDRWYGVGPRQLLEAYLHDERVLSLAERIDLIADPDLTARFPARFLARVTVETGDGRSLDSGETTFRGEQDLPFSESELRAKYRWLADDLLSAERVKATEDAVFDLPKQESLQSLLDCLAPPPDKLSR
jgi:2-methylcitrate dehydratase PrpD